MTSVEGPIIMDNSPQEGRTKSISRSSSIGEAEIAKNLNLISYDDAVKKLDYYYGIIKRQLLQYQSVTLGLFPSCSLERIEADVRSSIYCAAAVWSLHQAYRRIDDDRGKAYELGQSCVKCMRGILFCWMRQTENLGKFMNGQDKKNALHSKFHLLTGEELETHEEYNHLQLDIVSQYLIFLVQMTTSGLQIIYSMEEVKFVQNLVYYIERAYRTPDFGMWERGSKYNDGTPELHASSIGMAKAALEAINGCNLFGDRGATWSVIFVDIDAHNRNRSIFETLLPRESSSKNVDASLLPTISFPAFATHDELLYSRTKAKILKYLKGKWGFKRFLRDGFGTILEDPKKRYYQQGETKEYDGIECDWPIFYLYMIIEGVFKDDDAQIKEYKELLEPLMKLDIHGDPVVPKYFLLHDEHLSHERNRPGSQARVGSKEGSARNLFLWGQSMWVISSLLLENLLHVNELDLIRRHLPSYNRPNMTGRYSAFQAAVSDLVVQVLLIAESMRLQAMMATYGIQTQTPHEVEPVHICSSKELVKVYQNLGVSKKLELGGRPTRPIGSLGTSKIYSINGKSVLCYPLIFETSDFYLSHDMALLIDDIKTELRFVGKHWKLSGRPTVCLIIRENHMRDVHFRELLDLLSQLKSGFCEGVKVRTGRLQNLIASSCIEHLDFMKTVEDELDIETFKQLVHASHGYQSLTDVPQAVLYDQENYDFKEMVNKKTVEVVSVLSGVSNLQGRTQLLGILLRREGPDFQIGDTTVRNLLNSLFLEASSLRLWSVVRMCTALLSKKVESITPYITTVLVSGKQLTVGHGKTEVILDKPTQPGDIYNVFYSSELADDNIIQAVLQQEVVLYCGKLIATNPKLFDGILNIRIGWVIRAMVYYSREIQGASQPVEAMAPNEVRRLLRNVLSIDQVRDKLTPQQSRYINGCLGKTPKYFHEKIWQILYKAPYSIKLCEHLLPYHPTIADMFPSEQNFAIMVQKFLNHIENPEYRQCIVELFSVMSTILERNPELKFGQEVDLDLLMKDAVRMYLKDLGSEWTADYSCFYAASSVAVTSYLARAVVTTLLKGAELRTEKDIALCQIS